MDKILLSTDAVLVISSESYEHLINLWFDLKAVVGKGAQPKSFRKA